MIAGLNIHHVELHTVIHDPALVGSVEEFCAPTFRAALRTRRLRDAAVQRRPHGVLCVDLWRRLSLRAIHAAHRQCTQAKIHRYLAYSPQLQEVRSISMADLEGCSKCVHSGSCSRCPGLAYMEGNMRGPSIQDCEKSFARTGIPSENLLKKHPELVQITNFNPASPR